jgi:hypothetical protein
MRLNSEFGIRNSEWPPPALKAIWESRVENSKFEIRNSKFEILRSGP